VGKTYSVRQLGKTFQYFLEVNFESDKDIHSIFTGNLDPETICMKLSAYYNVPVMDGKTLLFFDEIQACIPAISSLRYFFEKRPELHLIAAGSLLEFALVQIPSFGVGRIESLYMYPLSFDEFLLANGQKTLYKLKQNASPESGFDEIYHKKLLHYLRQFILLGGMPEVISTFIETGNLIQSQKIIDNLINGLTDDFAKYRVKVPVNRIRDTFESVVQQSGGKFVLSKVSGNYNHQQIKETLNLLEMAGLVHKVTHTAANGLPLGAEANPKKVKLIIFDHGIFHRLLGLEFSKKILLDDFDFINKGKIAEQFVALEQLKYQVKTQLTRLFYWHREKRGSNAEVDFIIAKHGKIIPIEVKSGTTGKMQSLRIFIREKHADYGIRISLENFSTYENIKVYPLYAVHNLLNDQTR
jgi:predicted AAA+ superfamily ATPase